MTQAYSVHHPGDHDPATQRRNEADGSRGKELVERLRSTFATRRTRPIAWRLEQLAGLQRMLATCQEEILEALHQDVGKPHLEGFTAEVAYLQGDIEYLRRNLKAWTTPEKVATPLINQPGSSKIVAEPLGVVLIIAPWNYPLSLALQPLAAALAAGNCAVVKPSEVAAATSELIARRLPEFVDPTCVEVVEGGVAETTDLLDQRWDHIFYTGNGQVGRIVMTAAAKHLTPVTLELGGKSPCLVARDANLEVAARRIAFGKFFNAGQTCVAPDYLLVHHQVHDELLDRLCSSIRSFWGHDPRHSSDYGRIINQRHHDRLTPLLSSGQLVIGGEHDRDDRYIAPTIIKDVDPEGPVMADEIFGPILPVLRIDDIDEAIRFVNARPKPLALYVFSESREVQQRVIERTSAGGMTVNHTWMHLGVHGLPFGGVGESGMGSYHGKASFDCFSHRKSVLTRSTKIDPAFLYPPYGALQEKLIKKLL